MTKRELSIRQTLDCIWAKILTTPTALRAYRNRHLGTLMRCSEAWKPIDDCCDTLSFECIDFQRLGHIFACLTRDSCPPCTQTEKDIALARCRNSQRAWRNKKPVLTLNAVTDEEDHPLEYEDESARRLCEYWGTIFQAREEGPRHHQHEEILRFVQQAPDDINWAIDQAEFDDLLALLKDSAPGPDGIPTVSTDVLVAFVRSSSLMLIKPYWTEGIFLIVLLKVGQSLSLRLPIPMTLEGLFDHLMHFVH